MNDEGALIAFTLLSQLVIGSTLVYVVVYFFNMDATSQLPSGFSLKAPELLLLLGLLLAILLSFLHLGRPSNAINALNNLKSSWISREIFTVTLFSVSLLLLFMARWLGAGRFLLTASFVFAAIAGMTLLVTMVRLYMIPVVPAWNNWLTPAHFTQTALVSGLTVILVYVMVFNIETIGEKPILLAIMILLLFEILHTGFLYVYLNSMNFNELNPFISGGIFKPYLITRIALVGLAIISLLFVFLQEKACIPNMLLILSLSFIFIEMIIGRIVFFAAYFRTGI